MKKQMIQRLICCLILVNGFPGSFFQTIYAQTQNQENGMAETISFVRIFFENGGSQNVETIQTLGVDIVYFNGRRGYLDQD